MRAALVQMTSSDQPSENLQTVLALIEQAVDQGADLIATPEVTNCVSASRSHQTKVLSHQADDPVFAGVQEVAAKHGVTIALGSLAVKTSDPDGRFANRSVLIGPDGAVIETYDKIHMFDVQISDSETYHESKGYRPGTRAVVADTDLGKIGLTICYDIRFPSLYRDLAQAGARILMVPAAFSPVTGAAHWEALLRARAIETGCYVLAAAQTGTHAATKGKPRKTYGHSMAISPWGEVLADAGTEPGLTLVDLDLAEVKSARARVPSLEHDRSYTGPIA